MQRNRHLESKKSKHDDVPVMMQRNKARISTNSHFKQPEVVLEPPHGWLDLRLRQLWIYRELLFFFVWRDLKVRYKQTLLGAAWAILQPVMTMIVFSIIFGRLVNIKPGNDIPYPIFAYAGLLPWQLFSGALSSASASLVSNQSMITKVYFPRLLLPLASILSGLVDFGIAFIVLLGLMVYYHITLTWSVLFLPLFMLLAMITALAVGLWLSSFNVRYRDFKYVVPFLLQFWMYATPVAYPSTLIPEKWRLIFGLNPMAGVVDGFRWALLGQETEIAPLLIVGVIIVIILLVSGLIYFQRMEQTFADVI
jgi:lipopolysaccharide transport system permease protein